MVRRLPVIQSKAPEDAAAEERPAWHWILIGAGFVLTIWIPLALIALWLGRQLGALLAPTHDPEALARAMASASAAKRLLLAVASLGPLALSYAVATISAGALVGRFGAKAGRREAALAGLLAAGVAWSMAAASGSLSPWPVALGSFAVLGSFGILLTRWGANLGIKRRPGPT
jgi:tRNA-(ms[2]io[6]A)-hydroxylase